MGEALAQAPQMESHEPAAAGRAADNVAAPPMPARSFYPLHGLSLAGASAPDDVPLTRDNLLLLQRTVGNREVSRLLQRKAKPHAPAEARAGAAVGAGRAAAKMPTIQRKCACGGGCDECRKKQPVQRSQRPVQRSAEGAADTSIPDSVSDVLGAGGGHPLPQTTRERMEGALGTDLSAVRVHTGPQVARAAEAINAEAFTAGQDIYFGAGRYEPGSEGGQRLLAHELTHTVQQRGGGAGLAPSGGVSRPGDPQEVEAEAVAERVMRGEAAGTVSRSAGGVGRIQRYSWEEFENDVSSVGESVADVAGEVGDTVVSGAEAVAEGAQAVGGAVGEGAQAVGEAVGEGVDAVVEAGSEALDWLATEAGQLATQIADALGVSVIITPAGLEIIVPPFCPIDAILFDWALPGIEEQFMVPVFEFPIGPDIFISGEVGLTGSISPTMQLQVGPVCVNGIHILINPITNNYSIAGSVSATAAMALAAELRGGVRGELGLTAIIPVGPVPVPITAPLVGAEGGLAGMVRGIGAATWTYGGGLSLSGGTVRLVQGQQFDLGAAIDLFAGAYAQLDILGENICRLYWQPYEWHGDTAFSLTTATDLAISPGGSPTIALTVYPPSLASIPFSNIPLAISREGFSDDCPIKDRLCEILEALHLLPSQNGGVWSWSGPYGPGPRLAGPLEVYQKNPGIPSTSECRGACGPNCDTCASKGVHRYTDPATGDVWEYANFQDCNSNEGCREHDAAFDWAADAKGEIGSGAIIMPWHMAANIECMCDNLGGNCIAWVAGLPPFDSKMYFADSATLVSRGIGPGPGPGLGPSGSCEEDHPGALVCTEPNSDRDAVLEAWGAANQIGDFRDCRPAQASPGEPCEGAAGSVWHCTATDLPTQQSLTVSINECECCSEDGTFGSEWREPAVVVTGDMSEELILSLCERNLIARVICIPVEDEMIRRFGNRRRDLDLDPDTDPESPRRLDDAPIFESFRKIYNRLDSWNLYIRANHPDLFPEFTDRFHLVDRRAEWLTTVKNETKKYKERFRNIENQDIEPIQRDFENQVLRTVQPEMEALNAEIAQWFKEKTGSSEPVDELIERVHREGTELWREAWRKAILQVNRVLTRLWPPAKTRILVFIGQKRAQHPDKDLSGSVSDIDYIGSLATGFKGPPKQQIRFNPDKFDVDANLEAPPLAKYAVSVLNLTPDRGRIFGRTTDIAPLNQFSDEAHAELQTHADGYDASDPFDVAINAPELPTQTRQREGTERIYALRDKLGEAKYGEMIDELKRENLVAPAPPSNRLEVRADLTEEEAVKLNEILSRYEQGT